MQFDTFGESGYNVKFSPDSMAKHMGVVTGENYGIAGAGSLIVFDLQNPRNAPIRFKSNVGQTDLAWNKNGDIIATVAADGALRCSNYFTFIIFVCFGDPEFFVNF